MAQIIGKVMSKGSFSAFTHAVPVIHGVLDFLCRNFWALCFYDLLLGFVGYFWVSPGGSIEFFFNRIPKGIIGAFSSASVLMIIRGLLLLGNHGWGRFSAALLTSFAFLISSAELWVLFMFRCRLSDRILRLFLDTDLREASGFLSEYFFNLRSIGVFVGFLLFSILCHDLFRRAWMRLITFADARSRRFHGIFRSIVLIIFLLGNYASYKLDAISFNRDDSISRLIKVWSVQRKVNDRIRSMEEAIPLADGAISPSSLPPDRIIWILGESDNKHHSQLYGYPLPTTPNLMKEFENGDLICFSDVICYFPWTIEMMDLLFSPADVKVARSDNPATPLLPMLFRKAGYQVRLFDNQSTLLRLGPLGGDIGGGTIMNSRKLSSANFDYRNDYMEFFDSDLLKKEWPHLSNPSYPSLDIIHLIGMHFPSKNRYPEDFRFFTPGHYRDSKDLSDYELGRIADYDNALRYVDSELKMIFDLVRDEDAIVIYLPDHGELVYDIDSRSGRSFTLDPHPDPAVSTFYVEIPMYIFTTTRFRSLHPDLYSRLVAAKDEKFSSAWFSHFLLDIAAIESRFRRPDLSPVSPQWTAPTRPIWCADDYDAWKLPR